MGQAFSLPLEFVHSVEGRVLVALVGQAVGLPWQASLGQRLHHRAVTKLHLTAKRPAQDAGGPVMIELGAQVS